MEIEEVKPPSTDWFKWLGERRDGFLVGGAVLYGLGYLVWSYNAWRNHLGQLPAIEFQYLMSGLIPGAIIAIASAAVAYSTKLQDKAIVLFEKHPPLRRASFVVAMVAQTILLFGTIVSDRGWLFGWKSDQITRYTLPLFGLVLYFTLLLPSKSTTGVTSRFTDLTVPLLRYYLILLFSWYSLVVYFDLYPHLPQALGGPQPRCAYIDLLREEVAPSSLSVLVPSRPSDTTTATEKIKVVRSTKLNVYFSSNDYLLVRT